LGNKIKNYVDALKDLGYQPEQVSKILITHKHPDHTGALKHFPNAKIFTSNTEDFFSRNLFCVVFEFCKKKSPRRRNFFI